MKPAAAMLARHRRSRSSIRLLLVIVVAALVSVSLLSQIVQFHLQMTLVPLRLTRKSSVLGLQNSTGMVNHQLNTTGTSILPNNTNRPGEQLRGRTASSRDATVTVTTAETGYFYLTSKVLTSNISKTRNNWFEIFPDDEYLVNNTSVFQPKDKVRNHLNDTFLIKGERICQHGGPYLLVLIPSVDRDVALRDVIRWTWLKAAESNSWPRTNISVSVSHAFLLGYSQDRKKEYQQLLRESQLLGDIVMANFDDTYRNLSRKVLLGLSWARRYCPDARFVLKADQDTFINVPLMLQMLHHVAERVNTAAYILGLRHNYNRPYVVRSGRWGVATSEYPLDFYPRYLYGHTYALSQKAVSQVTDVARYVPMIAPEDALVTGILAKVANVTRISAPSFTVCCRDIFDCEVVWNQQVALPEIKEKERLLQLWTNILSHKCNNTVKFV